MMNSQRSYTESNKEVDDGKTTTFHEIIKQNKHLKSQL